MIQGHGWQSGHLPPWGSFSSFNSCGRFCPSVCPLCSASVINQAAHVLLLPINAADAPGSGLHHTLSSLAARHSWLAERYRI